MLAAVLLITSFGFCFNAPILSKYFDKKNQNNVESYDFTSGIQPFYNIL